MKIKLTLKKQNKILRTLEVDRFPFSIGRNEDNDLVLDDPHISRRHLTLTMEKERILIVKISETGKCLFQDRPVGKEALPMPAIFEIPPYSFLLEKLEEAPAVSSETESLPQQPFPSTLADDLFPFEPPPPEPKFMEETQIVQKMPKAKMIVLQGNSPYPGYDLMGEEIIVGRDDSCDIILDDERVSREHARIFLKADHYTIQDAGSTNGTYVNHKRIEKEQRLLSGDQIQIGDASLQFALIDEEMLALSPRDASKDADITQTGLTPRWEPEIPAYLPKRSWEHIFGQHRKMIYAGIGVCLLVIILITVNRRPPPDRQTAQEKTLLEKRPAQPQAKDELERLNKTDRAYVLAKMEEAKAFIKNRKYKDAKIAIDEIFTVAPHYKKAKALNETIQYTLRQQDLEEEKRRIALEEKKLEENIKYHWSLALDYFNRQQWTQAVEELDTILELRPDHEEAQQKRKVAEARLYQKSKPAPVQKSKNQNKTAESLLAQGSRLSQRGDYPGALTAWRKVLKLEGIKPEYYAKADKFIQYTKEKLSEQFLPLLTQAHVLIENKEHVKAKLILKKILKEYPSHEAAQIALDKADHALHQQARREYTEAIIEENVGRIDQAIQRFKWIITEVPDSDPYHQKAKKKLKKYE